MSIPITANPATMINQIVMQPAGDISDSTCTDPEWRGTAIWVISRSPGPAWLR
jgi:hypothetical protein